MNARGPATLAQSDLLSFSASPGCPVGTEAWDVDGNKYRYAQAGATSLVVGNLLQSPVANGSQINLAVNTALAVVGAGSYTITPGAAVAKNQYAGGLLQVSNGAGFGTRYRIDHHAAGNSSVNVIAAFTSQESVAVAANSVTRVDMVFNPYGNPQFPNGQFGVIQAPAALSGTPIGVAIAPITNGQFGWVGVHGYFPVLQECDVVTTAIGAPVGPSPNDPGAVSAVLTANAAGSSVLAGQIGYMAQVAVDLATKMVYLQLD